MKTLLVAVCAVKYEDKFALVRFKRNYLKGYLGIPGGKFDEGEFVAEAAQREIKEELDIEVAFQQYHGLVDEIAYTDAEPVRCLLFVCSVAPQGKVDQDRRESEDGGIEAIEWLTAEDLEAKRSEIVPSDYRILEDIVLGGQAGYWKCQQTMTDSGPVLDFFERVG